MIFLCSCGFPIGFYRRVPTSLQAQFWPAAGEWQPARLREALGADAAAGPQGDVS